MKPICQLAILFSLVAHIGSLVAEEYVARFNDPGALSDMHVEGNVTIDASRDRSGDRGGALRVPPNATAVWKLRETNGSGKIEMWVFDDGSAPTDPKKHGAGPMWGLVQEDRLVVTVGAVYCAYLSGDTTYAVSDFVPDADERPWWQVQYLGLKRTPGWHKWTFSFAQDGLGISYDDEDLNARRQVFNWNKTRLRGFTGVALLGDRTDGSQTIWVDDVSVTLGKPSDLQPLWPPPPPETLVTVPPQDKQTATPYARWEHGPQNDPDYFPIAVWLQAPSNAEKYKAAGINLYIGLWKGPTEEQLAELEQAGMQLICDQNNVGMKHLKDRTIVGWMHGDEPDNAQSLGQGKGYGPPVAPEKIVEDYRRIAAADPSRPVWLNLGQGVAWDGWGGRGVPCTNHSEDYAEYVQGCDVVSFDIYPAVHSNDEIRGNLWYVAKGVSRLRKWSGDRKIVWNCIECTHISNASVKPTPHQVRAEVWMSIIHGSRGLIYFVHQFKPTFVEAGLLADKEMLEGVTAINEQIHSLATVINSPTIPDVVTVTSSSPNVPVHTMVKRQDGATYLFAVSMYHQETEATFEMDGLAAEAVVEVIGEDRTIVAKGGRFSDSFGGYDVHIYRIR